MTKHPAVSVGDLERLYRARFHQYLRVAEAVAGNLEDGLDAVQEGFARALRHRADFRGDARLSTWVWRCVVNAARAARPTRELALDDDLDRVAVDEDASLSTLRRLIASLPERQRWALFLRYYADLDYGAIAHVLEIERGTVGATLSKAHATLRRQLEEVSQ
jgi:RNA polymerase sigma-70 factor (ECF subfamily)